ncbi:MAG: 4Fe-4S binding protein [Oscillospiraceae bacterium]|nr:4Fe-4S binding protein [Oscillospiraceae bacterium]
MGEPFGRTVWATIILFSQDKAIFDRLKIDNSRCIRCGTCVSVCPMNQISLWEAQAVPGGRCTMCYRCVSLCPVQAITLLGKRVSQ